MIDARHYETPAIGIPIYPGVDPLDGVAPYEVFDWISSAVAGTPSIRLTGGGISSGLDEALRVVELLTDTATAKGRAAEHPVFPPVGTCTILFRDRRFRSLSLKRRWR